MKNKSVKQLIENIRKSYNGDDADDPAIFEAREVTNGMLTILRENPDVDVECHFE